jgi:hypothetical protein
MFANGIRVLKYNLHYAHCLTLAVCQLLLVAETALAAAPVPAAEKSYVFPYFVVVMGVTLGLIVVCRPGKRSDDPGKPNRDD